MSIENKILRRCVIMSFCNKCGCELDEFSNCPNCFSENNANNSMNGVSEYDSTTTNHECTHNIPKCLYCGNIEEWKVEPLITVTDWIIIAVLFFFFGSGLIYLLITVIVRSNQDNRTKICKKCGAKNMFTFYY